MALLGLALISCHIDEPARADVPEFGLNEAFTLGGGQDALIPGENLRLRFTDVLEDSRCPTQVECFWTGQARITIAVQPEGDGSTTVEFNTNPAPGQTVNEATSVSTASTAVTRPVPAERPRIPSRSRTTARPWWSESDDDVPSTI